MTYADLLEMLRAATPEQLSQDVTVYVQEDDKFYPVEDAITNDIFVDGNGDEDIEHLPDFLSEGRLYLKVA